MTNRSPQLYFLVALLVGISILVFFIFRPFFYTLFLAIAFAVALSPIYEWVLRLVRGKRGIAAVFTTLIVVIFILAPLSFIGIQIFQEAWQLYTTIAQDGADGFIGVIKSLVLKIQNIAPIPLDMSTDVSQYIKQGLIWLLQHFGTLFSSIAQLALHSFIFLFSFYYILKDGHKIKRKVMELSPLMDTDDEAIFKKLHEAINSVIRGSLLIAAIQGTLTGIGLTIFGVPNSVLWGSVAAITALIPAVGTSLVMIPAIAFLFISGATTSGIGLTIWALIAVGLIDNMLGPKLVERGIRIHPLLILLSVLGGLSFFGPIGFLLGPLTLSLLFALIETYFSLIKNS